ncbi:MAG: DUF4827 domain-containing protein [Muribaculaceae bacterium]|nr:DUF4827 domain-containing protein [Muribaculaceae bacterium]
MKFKIIFASLAAALTWALASCNDGKTYAELLESEDHYVNNFLADNIVYNDIPADTVFETGKDAPYYRLDEEGQLYMQVINPGTPGNMAKDDDLIYFRYTRYNLRYYEDGKFNYGGGNDDDMGQPNTSFRYNNFSLESSSQWGAGIQRPLAYLPVDCQVNLVVKSQYGITSELAEVQPYLFTIRYYRPKI